MVEFARHIDASTTGTAPHGFTAQLAGVVHIVHGGGNVEGGIHGDCQYMGHGKKSYHITMKKPCERASVCRVSTSYVTARAWAQTKRRFSPYASHH
jgi:hypothetical protein